jgi:hypothetical protein
MEWRKNDIIDVYKAENANGIVFTANSVVITKNHNSELVMGAGAAKRIRDYFNQDITCKFGNIIKTNDARIQPDYYLKGIKFTLESNPAPLYIFALQVKRDFKDKGDLHLTIQSLEALAQWCQSNPEIKLVLNCPLIGCGGFKNQKEEVFDLVEEILKDCNVIVTTL